MAGLFEEDDLPGLEVSSALRAWREEMLTSRADTFLVRQRIDLLACLLCCLQGRAREKWERCMAQCSLAPLCSPSRSAAPPGGSARLRQEDGVQGSLQETQTTGSVLPSQGTHIQVCKCVRPSVILSTLLGRLLTRVRYLWIPTKGFVTTNRENCYEKSTESVFDHPKGKLVSEKEEACG